MLSSKGDGDEGAEEEQEEDEDDEMQSGLSDQDIDVEDSQMSEDHDLAQIEKFHHEFKERDAEINLDSDVQSLAQGDPVD